MFKLKLLKKMRIYSIFYILFLESINFNILVHNKLFEILLKNKYKVKKIKDYNIFTNQYLIK